MPLAPPEHLVQRFRSSLEDLVGSEAAAAASFGVAVSGGGDSLALLLLAAAAMPGRVQAATVDHRFRLESAREAEDVARLCDQLDVPHTTLTLDWSPPQANRQAAARNARYQELGRWAGRAGLAFVATAHHLDDQAETLLMRLHRGAGLSGLAGIRARRSLAGTVELIRPVLGWRRRELREVLAASGVCAVEDPANLDPAHDRTRARAFLERSPEWPERRRMAASASHLADAEEALEWAVAHLSQARLRQEGGKIVLEAGDLPVDLRRRLLRRAIALLAGGGEDVRGDVLARALRKLEQGEPAALCGLLVRPEGLHWKIAPEPPRRSGFPATMGERGTEP